MYHLLIVDDEYEIRNGLSNYFPWNEIGFHVVDHIENGEQALKVIQEKQIDVLLCDINMPILSGVELAKILFERNYCIKTVFFSGYRDFEYARQALEYGVRGYLVKPTSYVELKELFSRIKDELDQQRKPSPEINATEGNATKSSYDEMMIQKINTYIEMHYNSVTLESLAEHVSMNPQYISKFYKLKTGTTFSDYLIGVKMKKAAELLGEIQFKTYEISDIVGYKNPKNFTRTFKNFYGMSPRQYRNESSTPNNDEDAQ